VEDLEREHRKTLLREAELEDLSRELLEVNKAITVLGRNVKREKTSAEQEASLLISYPLAFNLPPKALRLISHAPRLFHCKSWFTSSRISA